MEYEQCCGGDCSGSAEAHEAALMAAVDGEADETTLRQLYACADCSTAMAELSALQRELRRSFYRLFCPSTDLLIDYCQGLVEPGQRARLSHHILACPYCSEELMLLEGSLHIPLNDYGPAALCAVRPAP